MRRVAAPESASSVVAKRKSGLTAGLAENRNATTPPHATSTAAQTVTAVQRPRLSRRIKITRPTTTSPKLVAIRTSGYGRRNQSDQTNHGAQGSQQHHADIGAQR